MTLVEILLHPAGKNEWLENERNTKKDKEVDGCTFKPVTLDYPINN